MPDRFTVNFFVEAMTESECCRRYAKSQPHGGTAHHVYRRPTSEDEVREYLMGQQQFLTMCLIEE